MGEPQQGSRTPVGGSRGVRGKGRSAVVALLALGEGLPGEEEVHGREDVLLAT